MKALLLGLVVTLVPFYKYKEPTLKNMGRGDYIAINPYRHLVTMKLNCGNDWEPVTLVVDKKDSISLRIVAPNGQDANCFLESNN